MTRYPLVLLDLDGTLVDSFADIAAGVRAACGAIGVDAADGLLALVRRGAPLDELYAHALGRLDDRFALFADAYRACYVEGGGCLTTTVAYPGVATTLAAIRALPDAPRIAVATTKRTASARRVLEGTGLLPLVDDVVGSDGLPAKPDPAILLEAAHRAGIDVRRALMVGDTDRDIVAARRAGARAAAVTYGGLDAEELARHHPDHLLGSFAELTRVLG
jgi:phosphoglycolate phosphatase